MRTACPDWDALDSLIEGLCLHRGDAREPVSIAPLLEPCHTHYLPLPSPCNGFRLQVEANRSLVEVIGINADLRTFQRSAQLRVTQAHEWAHIWLRHEGRLFPMWGGSGDPLNTGSTARYERVRQDRQADSVAAYVLVRRDALREMGGHDSTYIARTLDVTERLVEVRYTLLRDAGV